MKSIIKKLDKMIPSLCKSSVVDLIEKVEPSYEQAQDD